MIQIKRREWPLVSSVGVRRYGNCTLDRMERARLALAVVELTLLMCGERVV